MEFQQTVGRPQSRILHFILIPNLSTLMAFNKISLSSLTPYIFSFYSFVEKASVFSHGHIGEGLQNSISLCNQTCCDTRTDYLPFHLQHRFIWPPPYDMDLFILIGPVLVKCQMTIALAGSSEGS
jgi:hypothetical protein